MKVFLECIPCFLRQTLEAAKLATNVKEEQETALRIVLERLSQISWDTSPPHIGWVVHRLIKQITGNPDPYASLKRRSNEIAKEIYHRWQRRIADVPDALETALKLSLAGNVIDFGARPGEQIDIEKEVEEVMQQPLNAKEVMFFKQAVSASKQILFLGDNAGEILLDKFLIDYIGPQKVTFVVKKRPIINDATLEDAEAVGLTRWVRVIDNGSDYPGTVLEACSEEFRQEFYQADLIIAKGQGNYETLSETTRPIFFLLKVKCPVIAKDIKRRQGSLVIQPKNVYI